MSENIQLGLSFGAMIKDTKYLNEILKYKPSILEVPYSDKNDMQHIRKFCMENKTKISLHLPSYYSVSLMPYELTGSDIDGIEKNILYIESILEESDFAEYLVLHFPSPKPVSDKTSITSFCNIRSLNRLSKLQERTKIPIYIENITNNDSFYTPKDYYLALKEYPNIGLCLDLGHAHILSDYTINNFIETLCNQIRVIHFYDTPKKNIGSYVSGRHYPLKENNEREGEWIDYQDITNAISDLPNLKYLIFEPERELYLKYNSPGNFPHK